MKEIVITCPHCGAEYMPAEIYLPNEFLGKPKYIEKDHMTGKLLSYSGQNMNIKEHYVCDCCNKPFKVTARIIFATQADKDVDFSSDFSSKLVRKSLLLDED